VFPGRLLANLGIAYALITNAAGGIRSDLSPGDLMLIRDHINLTGNNPLVGASLAGPRFVDMSVAYDTGLSEAGQRAALDASVGIAQGIYAGVLGPSYETPAEVRMLKTMGADAVGMSTVLEVIALRQIGVRVGAMSLITNHAAGLSDSPLSHDEVQDVGRSAARKMQEILRRWIERVGEMSRQAPLSAR
jgi:purine-nucleoside phosphorylase